MYGNTMNVSDCVVEYNKNKPKKRKKKKTTRPRPSKHE